MRRTFTVFILIIGLLMMSLAAFEGCLGRQVAGPTPTYTAMGELKATLAAPLPKAYRASEAALRDLGIEVTESKADQLTGKVQGKLTDERTVNIDLRSVDANSSSVDIRVGTLGDEPFSRRILSQIEKNLPKF